QNLRLVQHQAVTRETTTAAGRPCLKADLLTRLHPHVLTHLRTSDEIHTILERRVVLDDLDKTGEHLASRVLAMRRNHDGLLLEQQQPSKYARHNQHRLTLLSRSRHTHLPGRPTPVPTLPEPGPQDLLLPRVE